MMASLWGTGIALRACAWGLGLEIAVRWRSPNPRESHLAPAVLEKKELWSHIRVLCNLGFSHDVTGTPCEKVNNKLASQG